MLFVTVICSCLSFSISSGKASSIQGILPLGSHPWFFISGIAIIGCTEFFQICHICNQVGLLGMIQKNQLARWLRSQICYFVFSLKLLIKFLLSYIVDTFLTSAPYVKQTNPSIWSKRSPCCSRLVHNSLKQVF